MTMPSREHVDAFVDQARAMAEAYNAGRVTLPEWVRMSRKLLSLMTGGAMPTAHKCGHVTGYGLPHIEQCGQPGIVQASQVYSRYLELSPTEWAEYLATLPPSDREIEEREHAEWLCPLHIFECPPVCPLCGANLATQPHTHTDPTSDDTCQFVWHNPDNV